ncbi:MAG: HAMP domain-containing histidine kinase [Candidatus Obscuribacterales bacterium]|nr:HAMP domain-containing histidine kinase [Candidatus Obscuribacterales bacterium]
MVKQFNISNLSLSQKGFILVAVPLVFEIVFVATLVLLLQQSQQEINRANRSKSISEHSAKLLLAHQEAAANLIKLWRTQTAPEASEHLSKLQECRAKIQDELKILKRLSKSHPEEIDELIAIEKRIKMVSRVFMDSAGDFLAPGISPENKIHSLLTINKRTEIVGDDLRSRLTAFMQAQTKIENESPQIQERNRNRVQLVLLLGLLINIVLCLALSRFFSRNIRGRLLIMNENAGRISKHETLHAALGGKDEISQLDNSLHEMARKLQELEQLKQEFQAMITHDLRSPLSAVNASLQLLSEGILGELPEKARLQAKKAKLSADFMLGLVNDLLDASKIETDGLKLAYSKASSKEILDLCINTVQPLADKKELKIDYLGEDAILEVDASRLARVIINFLSNAIKFSGSKNSIEIVSKIENGSFFLSVSDHGRGISEQDQKRIFDKFEQIEVSDATLLGGTGLGLAICKAVVEKHGGEIGVQSKLGEGSRFWFRVPTDATPHGGK